jgi:hypothetical protein
MSLENRAGGWKTPYTITPSAISSWVGEELRTIGPLEALDRSLAAAPHTHLLDSVRDLPSLWFRD